MPSAEMPNPENIRRIVTGPKSEKRSIRNSRSMDAGRRHAAWRTRYSSFGVRRLELHGLAATAGAYLVRIVEDELGLQLVGLVVHLGAEQEQHGLGVHQDLHALVLDDLVRWANFVGIFDRVGLPGAAAILDADPQAHDFGIGALCQFLDALRSSLGKLHDLRARARLRLGCR